MIEINNLTENKIDKAWVKGIVEQVIKMEKADASQSISIAFLGPGRMRKLNKKYRKSNRVTDVLSFCEIEVPFEKFKIGRAKKHQGLGEIVICPREVKKNAKRFKTEYNKEMTKMLIHGTLHLLGYSHEKTEAEATKMEKKEEKYLNSIK